MAQYNLLAEAHTGTAHWIFKVKIIRVYSYFVAPEGRRWHYVIADEVGTRMEFIIGHADAIHYQGMERKEGCWLAIRDCEVVVDRSSFSPTRSRYILQIIGGTRAEEIPAINERHFLEFASFEQILNGESPIEVSVDTMGLLESPGSIVLDNHNPSLTKRCFQIRNAVGIQLGCVALGSHAHAFGRGYSNTTGHTVIVVLKFWKIRRVAGTTWLESVEGLSDTLFNPAIDEAEDLRDEFEPEFPTLPMPNGFNGR